MRKLYKYHEDCGRMGSLEGLVILTPEELSWLKAHSEKLRWDEVLGKHSSGTYVFDDDTLNLVPITDAAVEELFAALGSTLSGCIDMPSLKELASYQVEEN